MLKAESPPERAQGNQYSFPSSSDGFTYDNSQQLDVTYPHSQTSSQMQNLASFSNVMVMHRVVDSWMCNIEHVSFLVFNELDLVLQ